MDHPEQIDHIFDLLESWQRIRKNTDDGNGPDYVTGYIHGLEDALLILGIHREAPPSPPSQPVEAPSV